MFGQAPTHSPEGASMAAAPKSQNNAPNDPAAGAQHNAPRHKADDNTITAPKLKGDKVTERQEANQLMVGGVAIGAMGLAGTALLGATCPVCVVAAPAMLGLGAYKRWRSRDQKSDTEPASKDAAPKANQ